MSGIRLLGDAQWQSLAPVSTRGQRAGLAVSPDGRPLAASASGNRVHLWEVATANHSIGSKAIAPGLPVCLLPMASACNRRQGRMAIVWDAATGKPLHRFIGFDGVKWGTMSQPSFAPDGAAIGRPQRWHCSFVDIAQEKEAGEARLWQAHLGGLLCAGRQDLGFGRP